MTTKKFLIYAAQILGLVGASLARWAMAKIVRYPLPKPASPADAFRFCLGFGFIGIGTWATILFMPKTDNRYRDTIGQVIAWIMGIDGIILVACSILLLK